MKATQRMMNHDRRLWSVDTDAAMIARHIAMQLLTAQYKAALDDDGQHDPTVCECCECHGHEYTVESAEPVGDAAAWVAVCEHCDATAHPDDVIDNGE